MKIHLKLDFCIIHSIRGGALQSRLILKLAASSFILILSVAYGWFSEVKFNHTITIRFYFIMFLSIFLSLFIIDLVS
jgi:hypothetical protein